MSNGRNGWEEIAALQDFLAGLRESSKPFPSIDYWLQQSLNETTRIVAGRSTKTADLADIIAACPRRSSLKHIEGRLEDLHGVASDLGFVGLATKIEAAAKQAHYEIKARNK